MNAPEGGVANPRDEPNDRYSITTPRSVTRQIDAIAEQRGSKRATIIREAVLDWLRRFQQRRAS